MKCIVCDHEKFYGHQVMRADVVCDGRGDFVSNVKTGLESAIYDSETPYGPFQCVFCGAEYEALRDVPDSATPRDILLDGVLLPLYIDGPDEEPVWVGKELILDIIPIADGDKRDKVSFAKLYEYAKGLPITEAEAIWLEANLNGPVRQPVDEYCTNT